MQRILVIDDTHSWNKLVGWHLKTCGFQIDSASSCEEALVKLRRSRPDCILMDSNLPDGTAVSLCAAMRLETKLPLPPIIIISADPYAEISAYKDCLAQRFILKDKNIFNLLPAQISEAIEKWSLENTTGPKEQTNHDKHR